MNAQEARKMAEEFEWTPEIDETIELIKKSANRGEFSTTTNRMKPSTQRYLERVGYKVRAFAIEWMSKGEEGFKDGFKQNWTLEYVTKKCRELLDKYYYKDYE